MPVHPLTTDLLTDGQRRHLIASLQQVAASLVEIESLAYSNGAPAGWPLAKATYDLPNEFGAAIEPHLTQARAQVADLVATLELQAPEHSARRAVQALVVSSLVVLEDTETRKLHGYGTVHPALADLLDPALSRIHQKVRAIGDVLAAATR